MLGQLKVQARKSLAQALPTSDRKKYRSELVVAVGAPFTRIIEYAKRNQVDLIVMGRTGRGALAHAILGSVTERVVRFAPCPVLAVRVQGGKKRGGRRRQGSSRGRTAT